MATGDITKTLNGVDLHNPARGWSLKRQSTARPGVTSRRSTVVAPLRHGAVSPRPRLLAQERTVSLTWRLQATSQASLERVWADLMALLGTTPLVYGHVAAGVSTVADANLVSVSEVSGDDFLVGTYLHFTALLALPGVFLRDADFQTLTVPAGTSTHTAPAGSAPITDVIVRFGLAGVAGVRSLTDVSTGTGISIDPASTSGTYVYVDAGTLTGWRNNSTAAWYGSTLSEDSRVDYPAPGPLQLWPAARESDGSLVREVRLQASHACTVRYRRAWL